MKKSRNNISKNKINDNAMAKQKQDSINEMQEISFPEDDFAITEHDKPAASPPAKSSIRRIFFNAAIVILAGVMIYQGYNLATYYLDLRNSGQEAERARNLFNHMQVVPATGMPNTKQPESSVKPSENALPSETVMPTETPAETYNWSDISPVFSADDNAELIAALSKEFNNEDIRAYLYIEGTNINYPIVQSPDNDFYLRHSLDKKLNVAGSIFIDFEVDTKDFTSKNTVIYGHNMQNGTMFHNVRYYIERQFMDEHRYIVLKYPDRTIIWEAFAAYHTKTDFNYIQVNFKSDAEFGELIEKVRVKSYVKTDIAVLQENQILTLSTCVGATGDERMVVHARLVDTIYSDAK